MYKRIIDFSLPAATSCFLWGPRQTGKSSLLRGRFPAARRFDLLLSEEYRRLVHQPSIIREECLALLKRSELKDQPIIVDEVQKVPDLLDEIHWLIENRGLRFILCGSSARKLKRGHGNLLGGRAWRYEMYPLVSAEGADLDLLRALNRGRIPF